MAVGGQEMPKLSKTSNGHGGSFFEPRPPEENSFFTKLTNGRNLVLISRAVTDSTKINFSFLSLLFAM